MNEGCGVKKVEWVKEGILRLSGSPKRAGYGPLRLAVGTWNLRALKGSTNRYSRSWRSRPRRTIRTRPQVCALFTSTYFPDSPRRIWLRCLDPCRIAGHSDIRVSARYVHPSEDAALNAMSRLGGPKIGHRRLRAALQPKPRKRLTR